MNILILGSGGREHALAYYTARSPHTKQIYIAPGNAGTRLCGQNLKMNITNPNEVLTACVQHQIDMLIIGPEAPLVAGLVDDLKKEPELNNLMIIGPTKAGAMLEGSKSHAKRFMQRHGIPTAAYHEYHSDQIQEALDYIATCETPIVIKADGLAAGKGVIIAQSHEEAEIAVRQMLSEKKFGTAGEKLIIEQFLDGIEMSCFVLTDGREYYMLPSSKDYKRIGEGDTGLNTGGMGAVSPVDFMDKEMTQKVEDQIIKPTIKGLQAEEIPYTGFIFFGLIKVGQDPYVIEYNCRLGDPETEVILARIENDLVELLQDTATGSMRPTKIKLSDKHASTVILASAGYPENYEKDKVIEGWDKISEGIVFHAGTKQDGNRIVTNGGRVLALTGVGDSLDSALKISYSNAELITFEGKTYRKDIGNEFL